MGQRGSIGCGQPGRRVHNEVMSAPIGWHAEMMKEKLIRRLEELKSEFQSGQQMEAELEGKLAQLRTTLLRISGAIQVIEELLDHDTGRGDGAPDRSEATSHTTTRPEAGLKE
jgi:hypothetical protein